MYIEIFLVITGCTRGVGFCYAKELAKRNMNLILMGRNEQRISEISELLLRDHPDIKIEILDIDFSRTEDFSKKIIESLDGKDIGILVNNVGVILPFPMYFNEIYEEQMIQMIDVNIKAATIMTKLILPILESKQKGAVINLASISGLSPQPLQTIYAATKAYMDFFSRGLQTEYSSKNITIQTICPSYICTSMTSFSPSLSTPSFFVPTPEDFAANAVKTIGFSNYTTGFWTHSLQNLFPMAFMPKLIFKLNERFRSQALKNKG